jgi:hypothetical protein
VNKFKMLFGLIGRLWKTSSLMFSKYARLTWGNLLFKDRKTFDHGVILKKT